MPRNWQDRYGNKSKLCKYGMVRLRMRINYSRVRTEVMTGLIAPMLIPLGRSAQFRCCSHGGIRFDSSEDVGHIELHPEYPKGMMSLCD